MEIFDSWEIWLIAAAVGWFFYKVGKSVGRQEQREWDDLKKQIDLETDPKKKLELQIRWAGGIENPSFRRIIKSVWEDKKKANRE